MDVLRSLVYVANSASSISKSHDIVGLCLRLLSVLTGAEKLPAEQRPMMEIDLFDWMVNHLLIIVNDIRYINTDTEKRT